jgi:hypothetical protein
VLRHGIPASRRLPEATLHLERAIMNTLLAPQRPSGLPDTLRPPSRDTRTSLLDRLALQLGLWLLLWSTRAPRLADDRRRHAQAYRHQEANTARERAYLREASLAPRP